MQSPEICVTVRDKVTDLYKEMEARSTIITGDAAIKRLDTVEKDFSTQLDSQSDRAWREGCRIRFSLGAEGLSSTCELEQCSLFPEISED